MKYTAILLFIATASACTSSSLTPETGGGTEHTVACSGSDSSWDACATRAKEICGERGYDELQKYEDRGAFVAYDSARVLPDRRLTFRCRE